MLSCVDYSSSFEKPQMTTTANTRLGMKDFLKAAILHAVCWMVINNIQKVKPGVFGRNANVPVLALTEDSDNHQLDHQYQEQTSASWWPDVSLLDTRENVSSDVDSRRSTNRCTDVPSVRN